ncbi:hypothetical protein AKO1_007622 [Acrasis kona]|uniref:Uncharacterized protein n=1 Tax=Acrasis kona TaxID=1008807 RepID=A0AAW2YQ60_9EUKA
MDNIRLIYRQHVLDYVKKITTLPKLDEERLKNVTTADHTVNTKDTILCMAALEHHDNLVAVGHRDSGIQLFSLNGEKQCDYRQLGKVSSLASLTPENMIACTFDTRMVKIFDHKKQYVSPKKHLTGSDICYGQKDLIAFGDRYFFVGCDGKCYLGDIHLCKELASFESEFKVHCIEVLPGNRIAAGNSNGQIHIFDFKRTKEITKLVGHTDAVVTMALLDDRTLATGSFDGTIRIWEVNEYTCKLVMEEAHETYVRQVTTLGHGLLVSVGEDGKINVWNVNTGERIATYTHGTSRVLNVAYRSGKLITTDVQGILKIWTIHDNEDPPADQEDGKVVDSVN